MKGKDIMQEQNPMMPPPNILVAKRIPKAEVGGMRTKTTVKKKGMDKVWK